MMDLGVADVDTSLQLARVIGSSMARIAEAEVSPHGAGTGHRRRVGLERQVEAADRFAAVWPTTRCRPWPGCSSSCGAATSRRRCAGPCCCAAGSDSGALPVLAVGFADMVGFTTLSQQLSEEELAAVVARFEEVAHDTVTAGGGRVVKMIGDEAMFVTESALDAARIGLALAEAYADDELLSDVRVALAVGPVLVQDGDFYGPVVNLASRVVNMAAPGAVIVSDEFQAAVPSGARPRRRRQRGVRLHGAPAPAGEGPRPHPALGAAPSRRRAVALDRRLGGRWERLAEVLHDLDELREKGERLIAGATVSRRSGRWRCRRGGARMTRRRARGCGPAGRRASPSAPPTVTVVVRSVGLKTRTSSMPGLAAHGRDLGPLDLERAGRRRGVPRPRGRRRTSSGRRRRRPWRRGRRTRTHSA